MAGHASNAIMEHRTRGRVNRQGLPRYRAAENLGYREGHPREEGSGGVQPPPARTLSDTEDYNDVDLWRPPSAQSVRSTQAISNTPLRYQHREPRSLPGFSAHVVEEFNARLWRSPSEGALDPHVPHLLAPAVNRDLKPSRRNRTAGKHTQAMQPREQHMEVPRRSSGSTLPKDLVNHISRLSLHKASRKKETKTPRMTYHEDDWYAGAYDRADAEHALHLVNKDGAFLVRDCSKSTSSTPFVLVVYHEKKVYNIKIRFIEHTNKYALGRGKGKNVMFDTVADIIEFHSISPIVLINRNPESSKPPLNCVLTTLITRDDINKQFA